MIVELLESLANVARAASGGERAVLGMMIAVVVILVLHLIPRTSPLWVRLATLVVGLGLPFAGWVYLLTGPTSSALIALDNTTWKCISPLCETPPKGTPRIRVVLKLKNERADPEVEGRIEAPRTILYGNLRGTLNEDLSKIEWDNDTAWVRAKD